jgi:hypothetical protein
LSETITCAILEDTNNNENIEDFQAHEEKSEEKKDNETESEDKQEK